MKAYTYLLGLFIVTLAAHAQETPEALYRLRALGQAYMEEEEYARAVMIYQQAANLSGSEVLDVIHLGFAQYKNDDNNTAIETLTKAVEMEPTHPYAHYMLGLAYKKEGQSNEKAIEHFRRAAAHPDTDTAPVYNLGLMLHKEGRFDEAVEWLQTVLEQDDSHSAAVYNLAMIAQKQGNRQTAMELFKRFQALKKGEDQKPADAFDESVFARPISFQIPTDYRVIQSSTLEPSLVPNADWTQRLQDAVGTSNGHILAVYQQPVDPITHVVVMTENTALYSFQRDATEKIDLHPNTDWLKSAAADFNNDGVMDVLLYHAAAVELLSVTNGTAVNRTQEAGIPSVGAVDALWVDYDHEGDLDLLLAHPDGDRILQNNGNGTFTDRTGEIEGLNLNGSLALAAADFDYDNDIDIVQRPAVLDIQNASPNHEGIVIFSNERHATFQERFRHTSLMVNQEGSVGVTGMDVFSLRQNHTNDVFLYMDEPMFPRFFLINRQWESVHNSIGLSHNGFADLHPISVFDINNDGFADLLDASLGYFRSEDGSYFHGVPPAVEDSPAAKNAFPVDWDLDGDLDIVVTYENGETGILENDGGHQNHSITLVLRGDKNNRFGFGAKVETKDGLFHTLQEVWKTPVHVGLGQRDEIDVLRVTWPNGIFQNIIHATAGQVISVTEKPGYAGSCPFVYAWNGERFEFVGDFLSTGPLGLYLGKGYFPPRSNETVRIGGDQLRAKDGQLELRLTEELREVIYLDQIELLSVDHPVNMELHVNERFTVPPFPDFGLLGLSDQAAPPARVLDQRGRDVTPLISQNDHRYLRPFQRERFDGVGSLHGFEIELDPNLNLDHAVMFLTGYINWADSSIVRHIVQNPDMDFIMPYLQVLDADGEWETVMNPMGFPAGKLKTIPIDLSGMDISSRKLRIVATVQIHWDRIWIDPSPIRQDFHIHHHPLASADLRYGGFSAEYELAGEGPVWYDYSHRTSNPKWDYQRGTYTRYGDVAPLLSAFDDRYAILATGDEVAVRFDAATLRPGMQRTYFMRAHGWVKDADHSTAYSQTVEPLPFQTMSAYPYSEDEIYPYIDQVDYWEQYNTRTITHPIEPLKLPQRYQ